MNDEDRPGGDAGTALKSTVRTTPRVTGATDAEVVAPMDLAAAERLDKLLRNQARAVAHSMERFKPLIELAKATQIHETLNYASWTAYISDVIGKEMKQLPVADRQQIVALLSGEGMSQRGIAKAVNVSQSTVRDDLNELSSIYSPDAAGSTDQPDHVTDSAPATVTSLNGRVHPRHKVGTAPATATKPRPNTVSVPMPTRAARRTEKLQRHILEQWAIHWDTNKMVIQEFGTLASWMTPDEAKQVLREADKYLTQLNRIRKQLRERADQCADDTEKQ